MSDEKKEDPAGTGSSKNKLYRDELGFYNELNGKKQYRTSPIRLLFYCRSDNSTAWAKTFEITDPDEKKHQVTISQADLVTSPGAVLSKLADKGFRIFTGERRFKEILLAQLSMWNSHERRTITTRTGWHGNTFVAPTYNVGIDENDYIFDGSGLSVQLISKGTIEDWKENVGKFAEGNSLVTTLLASSFTAPLISILKVPNFGFHIHGPSSCGKTLSAQIAASVYSCPMGENNFIKSWRSTGNALEGMAKSHNDLPLFLDEIAEIDVTELKKTIYMLSNAQGKGRSDRNGEAKARKHFSLIFISTGEETIETLMYEAREKLKAGQEVRLIELEADLKLGRGVFQELHEFEDSMKMAKHLKEAVKNFYGTAGKEFLTKLADKMHTDKFSLMEQIQKFQNEFLIYTEDHPNPQVSRVRDSCSIVAVGGELAVSFGILPFKIGFVTHSVLNSFNSWLNAKDRNSLGDDVRAIEQVKYFFETDGDSRFPMVPFDSDPNITTSTVSYDRLSFKRGGYRGEYKGQRCWFVSTEVFKKEVCRGLNSKEVAAILKSRGLLLTNGEALYTTHRFGNQAEKTYIISERILEI